MRRLDGRETRSQVIETGDSCLMRSALPKKKSLSLMIGPPMLPPN